MMWKPGQTEFVVSLVRGSQYTKYCRLPAPIVRMLKNPEAVEFSMKGGKVTVKAAKKRVSASRKRKSA